jgi:hypothetical protein
MAKFKAVHEFFEPDIRYRNMVSGLDFAKGVPRLWTKEDQHNLMTDLGLSDAVPETIRDQFDVVRHVFVCAWFDYELTTVAEQHAYSVLEMALKARIKQDDSPSEAAGLSQLFRIAFDRGWLNPDDFEVPAPTRSGKLDLLDTLRAIRNNLMHGSMHLTPWGSREMIELCAEIIERLFKAPVSGLHVDA